MASSSRSGSFGTFGGVFTPSTLTILGVIMFLRFGQVVGESGIINAVIIVLAAKLITILTALSVSAIATNTRVEGGGAYFLISRSLGVEFGGAIGIAAGRAFLTRRQALRSEGALVSTPLTQIAYVATQAPKHGTVLVAFAGLVVDEVPRGLAGRQLLVYATILSSSRA